MGWVSGRVVGGRGGWEAGVGLYLPNRTVWSS